MMKAVMQKYSTVSLFIIALGIMLRVREYATNRSFWVDEAALALNIINKTPLELLKPLSYDQAAPYGFLLLEKFAFYFFGNTEYALRFFPLIFSIGSVVFFYVVSKKILVKKAVFIALVLFVLSDVLIYYASEVKQYGGDVVVVLLIYLAVLNVLQKKEFILSDGVLMGLIGILAVWFSHPAIFILAGAGFTLYISSVRRKRWKDFFWLFGISFSWFLSWGVYYFASLQFLAQNKELLTYHQSTFAPAPISLSALDWYRRTFIEMFASFFSMSYAWIWIAFFLFGVFRIFARSRITILLLLSPILPALLASALGAYPFYDRFLLFLIPMMLICIGEGIYQTIRLAKQKSAYLVTLVFGIVALLFFQHVSLRVSQLIHPRKGEDIKPIMQYVQEHRREGDRIYVYYASDSLFQYYAPKYGMSTTNYIQGVYARGSPSTYTIDMRTLKGSKRVWFIFSHVFASGSVDEEQFFLIYLDQIGKQVAAFKAEGAAVYLYDLSSK